MMMLLKGGETTFTDLIDKAEEFRVNYPEEFRTLSTVLAPFDRIHADRDTAVHMSHRRPAILLNNQDEIINIKWSPAYHGPIALEEAGYLNIDDYKSKLMILNKKYGDGSPIRRVFNTDWS
ncbi:hypothetical protein KUTeg_006667 [Tegillarca granosa]|uniref:Uncharacterized protein n=1 Tax=Tegillarca granosa TaxID=220873 RepID=A0ABQ9FF84_TEGGR|nr:hypothetical protein KUTeg_006667 [Tegillarca granosa]